MERGGELTGLVDDDGSDLGLLDGLLDSGGSGSSGGLQERKEGKERKSR